jgi:hypothetical protein
MPGHTFHPAENLQVKALSFHERRSNANVDSGPLTSQSENVILLSLEVQNCDCLLMFGREEAFKRIVRMFHTNNACSQNPLICDAVSKRNFVLQDVPNFQFGFGGPAA